MISRMDKLSLRGSVEKQAQQRQCDTYRYLRSSIVAIRKLATVMMMLDNISKIAMNSYLAMNI